MTKEVDRSVAVRMDDDLYNGLLELADKDRCSVSAVVRLACLRYIEYKDAERVRLDRFYESQRRWGDDNEEE